MSTSAAEAGFQGSSRLAASHLRQGRRDAGRSRKTDRAGTPRGRGPRVLQPHRRGRHGRAGASGRSGRLCDRGRRGLAGRAAERRRRTRLPSGIRDVEGDFRPCRERAAGSDRVRRARSRKGDPDRPSRRDGRRRSCARRRHPRGRRGLARDGFRPDARLVPARGQGHGRSAVRHRPRDCERRQRPGIRRLFRPRGRQLSDRRRLFGHARSGRGACDTKPNSKSRPDTAGFSPRWPMRPRGRRSPMRSNRPRPRKRTPSSAKTSRPSGGSPTPRTSAAIRPIGSSRI